MSEHQYNIFDPPKRPPTSEEKIRAIQEDERPISQRFLEFHQKNPVVYREFVRLAREVRAAGHQRIGARMIWEVMRWNLTVRVRSGDDFKLNDHYHARYVRLVVEQEPDLADAFELRTLRAE